MNLNAYRRNWLKLQKKYENKAFKIVLDAFIKGVKELPFDKMDANNYKAYLAIYLNEDLIKQAYLDLYETIGIEHGLVMGKLINEQINQKDFVPNDFQLGFRSDVINFVLGEAGTRITLVEESFVEYIKSIIATGLENSKTLIEIQNEIFELIKTNNFYRWQALRIARTEVTAAANFGAVQAGNNSRLVYDKVWISANDSRVRTIPPNDYDHREMNGVKVPKNEPFNVNGELIMYAGAPKTVFNTRSHAGNVINCRCANVVVARRDAQGNIIRLT